MFVAVYMLARLNERSRVRAMRSFLITLTGGLLLRCPFEREEWCDLGRFGKVENE